MAEPHGSLSPAGSYPSHFIRPQRRDPGLLLQNMAGRTHSLRKKKKKGIGYRAAPTLVPPDPPVSLLCPLQPGNGLPLGNPSL